MSGGARHVETHLEKKLRQLGLSPNSSFTPLSERKLQFKLYFPRPPYPQGVDFKAAKVKGGYNFVGHLLGHAGSNLKAIQQSSGCKVEIQDENGNLNGLHPDCNNPNLHALLASDSLSKMERAVQLICMVFKPENAIFEPFAVKPGGSAVLKPILLSTKTSTPESMGSQYVPETKVPSHKQPARQAKAFTDVYKATGASSRAPQPVRNGQQLWQSESAEDTEADSESPNTWQTHSQAAPDWCYGQATSVQLSTSDTGHNNEQLYQTGFQDHAVMHQASGSAQSSFESSLSEALMQGVFTGAHEPAVANAHDTAALAYQPAATKYGYEPAAPTELYRAAPEVYTAFPTEYKVSAEESDSEDLDELVNLLRVPL